MLHWEVDSMRKYGIVWESMSKYWIVLKASERESKKEYKKVSESMLKICKSMMIKKMKFSQIQGKTLKLIEGD